MPTLTSTGAVNLTSSSNWSPALVPTTGDDLIVNHTLTLDADMTLNTILFGTNGRLAFLGTSRTVIATNGFTYGGSIGTTFITTPLPSGTSWVLEGSWTASGNFNFVGFVGSTGGNLTLRTVGSNPSAVLFELTNVTSNGFLLSGSWTGGTLTTIGRFNMPNWVANSTILNMSGGMWNHTNTGTSLLGAGAHQVFAGSGTSGINWSGNLTSTSVNAEALFVDAGSTASSFVGTIKRTGNTPTTSFFAGNISPVLRTSGAKITTITGAICVGSNSRCPSIVTHGTTASTRINWRSQAVTIPSTDAVVLLNGGSSVMDMTDLRVSNAGRFVYLEQGAAQTVVDSSTLITNTTTSAQACVVSNSGALDGKVINLASDAPTLPTVSQVAGGTVYGYSAAPLTGTGVISDPAVIAAAAGAAMTNALNAISSTALARFASVNTGQTSAADGSVAKLAQGGTVDLSEVLAKLPVSGRAATASDLSVTVNPTVLSAGSISDIRSGLGTSAKQDQILTAIAGIDAGGLTPEESETLDSIAIALAGSAQPTGVSMREQLTEIHEAVFPPDPEDSPLVITPDDPGRVTGYAVCYGLDGEPASGIVVTYKLQSPPPRDVGRILNGATTGTRTSASNGLITFPGLFPGSTYYFTCGSTTVSITIPLDADSQTGFELPSFKRT